MSPAESERRIVTVLFADLVGFTPLVERLDPEDAATVQLELFRRMRETLERHGGEVAKFAGDAVLAVFGGTRTRDDDAERAVLAGLDRPPAAGAGGLNPGRAPPPPGGPRLGRQGQRGRRDGRGGAAAVPARRSRDR